MEKIVQIFNDETQERINCLPATFKSQKICGVKWVSVFPPNTVRHGVKSLSAVVILSETEHGFPIAFMEGTLCSNIRVCEMEAILPNLVFEKGASDLERATRNADIIVTATSAQAPLLNMDDAKSSLCNLWRSTI